jgi:hypothetical protein
MPKEKLGFDAFIIAVPPMYEQDMRIFHEKLLTQGLELKVEQAASGPVASYTLNKKTVFNCVFRKNGMFVRLYGEHLAEYENLLENLPEDMVKAFEKAAVCKRLAGTAPCSDRCPMGYVFHFRGAEVKKCRYSLLLPVGDESLPIITALIENEIALRKAMAA